MNKHNLWSLFNLSLIHLSSSRTCRKLGHIEVLCAFSKVQSMGNHRSMTTQIIRKRKGCWLHRTSENTLFQYMGETFLVVSVVKTPMLPMQEYRFDFWLGNRSHMPRGASNVCVCVYAAATAKSLQLCPTLCDPIDGNPPGSAVPGILQAITLEWVAFPSPMHESEKWKWSHSVVSNP